MRVQTEEWRRFIPGIRMYQGKMTLFYNGENIYDTWTGEYLIYDHKERKSWEVIIVLPGVEVIPELTFYYCENVKTVIMSETVRRIEKGAFECCRRISYVRLSRNLEYIGRNAFAFCCLALTSIFIPPSCRVISWKAFTGCKKLIILSVPHQTQLGGDVIINTAMIEASPFRFGYENNDEVNEWIKNIHRDEQFSLHRACASYNPLEEVVFGIIRRKSIKAFKKKDSIGVTPSQYLSENPFAEIKEQKMIKRYVLDMMGEVI